MKVMSADDLGKITEKANDAQRVYMIERLMVHLMEKAKEGHMSINIPNKDFSFSKIIVKDAAFYKELFEKYGYTVAINSGYYHDDSMTFKWGNYIE